MKGPAKRVIVILADGVRYDQFRKLIDEGALPAASRLFLEEGSLLKASTVFPSTTGPAYLPFLTGCSPALCDVPGIRWFDKSRFGSGFAFWKQHRSYVGLESFLINRDIPSSIKTVFEIVDDSYSIFNPITRGAGRRNLTSIMRIWYWYYSHLTDFWSIADEAALEKALRAVKRDDLKFLFLVFPGVDEHSHLSSPNSSYVLERYRWLDSALDRLSSEDSVIWLVSDHGLSETHTHFCLNKFLEDRDLAPFHYPMIFDRVDKVAANMVSGNGMAHIYLKGKNGWDGHLTKREIERISSSILNDLVSEDAIDLLACRDDDGWIEVLSKNGDARIKIEGDNLHYEIRGSDPFLYDGFNGVSKKDDILKATIDSDYPDGPFQLASLFNASRSGDIIVSAKPGFDLRLKYESPEHRSSHGSLHREHMLVPICCNQKFSEEIARTVDVFPTVLKQLGYPIPSYVEGTAFQSLNGV